MTFVDRVVPRIVAAISLAVLVSSALVVSQHQACAAANYPDKAVRIVLPFAAGGVADITARIIAEKLGDKLGQRFYVENQPGAGGIAAARTVIASPPDGYTLALLSNGTAISGRNRFHHHSLSGDSRGPNIAHARRHCAPDRQLLLDERQSCRQEIPGACFVGGGALGSHA